MTVLHVLSSLNPKTGGVSLAVHNFIVASETSEYKHEALCFDFANEDFIKEKSYTVHALGRGKTAWNYHPKLIAWLAEHLFEYDAVIIHGLWQYQSYAIMSSLEKLDKKKVPDLFVMPHGMLDPYFQRAKGRRFKAIRNVIFWYLIEKKLINKAKGMLFTCEEEMLLAQQTFSGYKPSATLNIGLGITAPPIYQERMSTPIDKPYWLFLSRIHPKKGIDMLINAYKNLLQHNRDIPDLVIAGPNDNVYAREMMELAGNNSKIHFVGMLQGNEKWGAIYGCEAFILSSHQENFGIAVVEALACHKPVLISDQVNIWREVSEGEGGIITRDTEVGVYKLLSEFHAMDSERKKKMSNNAYQVYQKHFTIQKAADNLTDILYGERNS